MFNKTRKKKNKSNLPILHTVPSTPNYYHTTTGWTPPTFRESLGLPERFTTSRALGTSLSTRSTCCTRSFSSLVFISFTWMSFGLMLLMLGCLCFFGNCLGRRIKNYLWDIAGTWLFMGCVCLRSHYLQVFLQQVLYIPDGWAGFLPSTVPPLIIFITDSNW